MRLALALIIVVLSAADAFALDLSLVPGLSVKNVVIYAVAGTVLLRAIVRGGVQLEMGPLQGCFAALICYAALTMSIDGFVLQLPHYALLESAMFLKTLLVDGVIVFCVFFYGLRSVQEAQFIIKVILAGLAFASAVSIADVAGIISLGVTEVGKEGVEAGRVFGAFGHANDTAALIVALLPAYVAVAIEGRGLARAVWIALALVCLLMLMLTVSRGGFVGLVVGGLWGATLCRRYLSPKLVMGGVAAVFAVVMILVPVIGLIGAGFGETFVTRLYPLDVSEGGSGRTGIWLTAIEMMLASPLALLTGFGWNSWFAKGAGFYLGPHNQYLSLWFELGFIGLAAYAGIVWNYMSTARYAIDHASGATRAYLIAFVIGSCMLAVAIAFTVPVKPWPYIWAFVGATCRIAVETINARRRSDVRSSMLPRTVVRAAQRVSGKRATQSQLGGSPLAD